MENMPFLEGFMPRFITSGMTDPLMNLSTEEYLFERMNENDFILLTYVNEDSVIIGRHQNPWLECPVELLEELRIPVLRRISGGGTVYHDGGNLNFSFMMRKEAFRKERNLTFVLSALENAGIYGELSGRGDIVVSGRKISGNAQCFRHDRSLHHGTILVGSDLERLTVFMRKGTGDIRTHAVASVSSPVSNLEVFRPGLSVADVTEALYMEFSKIFGSVTPERILCLPDEARQYYERNGSWEWIYGKCPAFGINIPFTCERHDGTLSLKVEDGIIGEAVFSSGGFRADLTTGFSGERFDRKALMRDMESGSVPG